MSTSPASTSPPSPWYRRRWLLIWSVVLVVAAVTVVTDLPRGASRSVQVSGDTSLMRSINAAIRGCGFAAGESFNLRRDEQLHDLTAKNQALVPGLLRDDEVACSFTNEDIVNLSNTEVPSAGAGRYLQQLVSTVTTWATSDALQAIEAIDTLRTAPNDAGASKRLVQAERELASDRRLAFGELRTAERLLRATLPAVALPSLPIPGPTAG